MPQAMMPVSSALSLIGNAVGPAALITTTAILLSGYTSKYSGIADQMRRLTAEYRQPDTPPERRASLRRQLALFHRRITAMWGASTLLSLALICFVGTVLTVLLSAREMRIAPAGVGALLIGLVLVAGAVGLELYEIGLARLTTAGELADILPGGDAGGDVTGAGRE